MIYPPFSNIRKISAHIAANVAAKAYDLGEPPSTLLYLCRRDSYSYMFTFYAQSFVNMSNCLDNCRVKLCTYNLQGYNLQEHKSLKTFATNKLGSYNTFISFQQGHIFALIFCLFYVGLASRLPRPENLVKYAESCMYSPVYRSYR